MTDDACGIVGADADLPRGAIPPRTRPRVARGGARSSPENTARRVYLGSTYVPLDDSCFSRFEAECVDDVRDVNEIAGVPFARIVAAAEIGIDELGSADEGGSS